MFSAGTEMPGDGQVGRRVANIAVPDGGAVCYARFVGSGASDPGQPSTKSNPYLALRSVAEYVVG